MDQNQLSTHTHTHRPLAKKLAECGVFGVASDEYLNYALENRKRLTTSWTQDGDKLVVDYLERYKQAKNTKHGRTSASKPSNKTQGHLSTAKTDNMSKITAIPES